MLARCFFPLTSKAACHFSRYRKQNKMKQLSHALAGIGSAVLFGSTYFVFSQARPEFSHVHKAVSELGAIGAPHAVWWNLLGYILPGLLISYFGIGLHRAVVQDKAGKLPLYGLVFCGLFMTLAGIFPGDFENRNSITMLLHTVGSLGSFAGFLTAAFSYPFFLKQNYFWEKTILPSLLFTWLSILSGFLRTTEMPGLGQRVGFLLFFIWIVFMSIQLFRFQTRSNRKTGIENS